MADDSEFITAKAAAARLGIRPATLYAYVSRGVVRSHRRPGGRGSWFDPVEIEALRRGTGRRPRRSGVDLTVATAVTRINGTTLSYRGHDARALSRHASFEAVATLLWTGALGHEAFEASPEAAGAALQATQWLPNDARLADRLALIVAAAAAADPLRFDLSAASVVSEGRTLIAAMADSLVRKSATDPPPLVLMDGQVVESSIAGRLWVRLAPGPPPEHAAMVLNGYLVLLADHELATSTVAARVAASTRANPYAAVAAALGALDGPLHGTVSEEVYALLIEASGELGPTGAVADRLRRGQPVPGFGHPLYPNGDPRGAAGIALLHRLGGDSACRRRLRTVDHVCAAAGARTPASPNSDFSLGALAYVADMASDAGEGIFAIARTAGWIAHVLEEYGEPPLRFRARALYPGTADPNG